MVRNKQTVEERYSKFTSSHIKIASKPVTIPKSIYSQARDDDHDDSVSAIKKDGKFKTNKIHINSSSDDAKSIATAFYPKLTRVDVDKLARPTRHESKVDLTKLISKRKDNYSYVEGKKSLYEEMVGSMYNSNLMHNDSTGTISSLSSVHKRPSAMTDAISNPEVIKKLYELNQLTTLLQLSKTHVDADEKSDLILKEISKILPTDYSSSEEESDAASESQSTISATTQSSISDGIAKQINKFSGFDNIVSEYTQQSLQTALAKKGNANKLKTINHALSYFVDNSLTTLAKYESTQNPISLLIQKVASLLDTSGAVDYPKQEYISATKYLKEIEQSEKLTATKKAELIKEFESALNSLELEQEYLKELNRMLKDKTLYHNYYLQMDHHPEPKSETIVGLNLFAICDPEKITNVLCKYIGRDFGCSLHEMTIRLPIHPKNVEYSRLGILPVSTIEFGLSSKSTQFYQLYRAAIYSPEEFYNLVCPDSAMLTPFTKLPASKLLRTIPEIPDKTRTMIEYYHYSATMLGSGNHFAEIGEIKDAPGGGSDVTVRFHVGSRSLGEFFRDSGSSFGYSYEIDKLDNDPSKLTLMKAMALSLNISYSTALLYAGTICMTLTRGYIGHENMKIINHKMLPHNYFNVQLGACASQKPLFDIPGDNVLFEKVAKEQREVTKSLPMVILRKGSTTFHYGNDPYRSDLISKVMLNPKDGVLELNISREALFNTDNSAGFLASLCSVPHGSGRRRPIIDTYKRSLNEYISSQSELLKNTYKQNTTEAYKDICKGLLHSEKGLFKYNDLTEGSNAYKSKEYILDALSKIIITSTSSSTTFVIKENGNLSSIHRIFLKNSISRGISDRKPLTELYPEEQQEKKNKQASTRKFVPKPRPTKQKKNENTFELLNEQSLVEEAENPYADI